MYVPKARCNGTCVEMSDTVPWRFLRLQEATRLDPDLTQGWNLLGLCRTSQGDIEEGVRGYKKALALNPKLQDAWINMAQAMKEVRFLQHHLCRLKATDHNSY